MNGWRVVRLDSVASTMDEINALGELGEPGGAVVVAREQTAGRGRAGRSWQAPPGSGLFLSALHRTSVPARRLGALPLLAGVAVAVAIENACGLACRLKWPNDVLAPGGKIAGVLVTARLSGDAVRFVNIGIGVNCLSSLDDLPPGAASILSETNVTPSPAALLDPLLECLAHALDAFDAASGEPILEKWLERAEHLGEFVSVVDGGEAREGRFVGLDRDGALLLEDSAGRRIRVVAGDLTRGPRQAVQP